jgi:hypothetical protein
MEKTDVQEIISFCGELSSFDGLNFEWMQELDACTGSSRYTRTGCEFEWNGACCSAG